MVPRDTMVVVIAVRIRYLLVRQVVCFMLPPCGSSVFALTVCSYTALDAVVAAVTGVCVSHVQTDRLIRQLVKFSKNGV